MTPIAHLRGAARALALALALLAAPAMAQTVEIPGTGAAETLLRRLADEFNRREGTNAVSVPPSIGSSGGIKRVMAGEATLARVARPLREAERAGGLRALAFARDAVVFVAGERVEVTQLTPAQVADVFAGAHQRWSELGGADQPIRVLSRELSESSAQVLRAAYPPFLDKPLGSGVKLVNHDYEMVESIDKFRSAIGFMTQSTLAACTTQARVLAVGAIAPSLDNLLAGRYPATLDYSFVFGAEAPEGTAARFIDFVFSAEGARLIRAAGVMPMARE